MAGPLTYKQAGSIGQHFHESSQILDADTSEPAIDEETGPVAAGAVSLDPEVLGADNVQDALEEISENLDLLAIVVAAAQAGIGQKGQTVIAPLYPHESNVDHLAAVLSGPAIPSGINADVLGDPTLVLPAFTVENLLDVNVTVVIADATGDNTLLLQATLGTIPAGDYAGGDWHVDFIAHAPTIVGADLSVVAETHIQSAAGTPYMVSVCFRVQND